MAGSFVDENAEPDKRSKEHSYEPRFSVGMMDPPKTSNVTALDPHGIGDEFGFTAFATEPVEECFEWFFEEDYQSLFESYRWA